MNRKSLIIMALAAAVCLNAAALPSTSLRPSETVLLYADEFSDPTDPIRGEKITAAGFKMVYDNEVTCSEVIGDDGFLEMTGKYARFDLYFPENPNGQMIVECQGGGYGVICSFGGVHAADWLLERGITVAVLKYRLPYGHPEVLLEDIRNTMRYCRAHAEEWGVTQIGVAGDSAGGHLAGIASVMYEDSQTRPDFAVLLYPVVTFRDDIGHLGTRRNMIGEREKFTERGDRSWEEWNAAREEYESLVQKYSIENQVSPDTPPMFIALSTDDRAVSPECSLVLYRALMTNKVPVEMHIYDHGGHGWGFASKVNAGTAKDPLGTARWEFCASLDRWLAALRETSNNN